MIKSIIIDNATGYSPAVDSTPNERRALVVSTRPLKTYDPTVQYFTNNSYGFDLNVNGAVGGSSEVVYDDGNGTVDVRAWVTTSALTSVKSSLGGSGTVTDSLSIGGFTTAAIATTEIWNGSSWATTTVLNNARYQLTTTGTTTACLAMAGNTTATWQSTEIWNGSSWATTSNLSSPISNPRACGTSSDAICTGGIYLTTVQSYNQIWNGSVWATTTGLITARYSHGCVGTTASSLVFCGATATGTGSQILTNSKWDGSVWATTNSSLVARRNHKGTGTATTALSFGGHSGAAVNLATTEKWYTLGGWVTETSMNVARDSLSGSGTFDTGLSFGGTTGVAVNVNTTEKYTTVTGVDGWIWTIVVGVGSAFNFNSTAITPHSGTYCISGTGSANGNIAQATARLNGFDLTGLNSLNGWINVVLWDNIGTKQILVYGWNSFTSSIVGTSLDIGNYINKNQTGVWQSFTLPFVDMELINQVVNAFRFQVVDAGGGANIDFYLDDITLYEGSPIEFTINPVSDTWLHMCSINFSIADNLSGIVTVAGATENATFPLLSYDKILGLTSLSNGILFQIKKNGMLTNISNIKTLFDFITIPPCEISGYGGDGVNSWIQLKILPPAPFILKPEEGDYASILIQDDLSGLLAFRVTACCEIEKRGFDSFMATEGSAIVS